MISDVDMMNNALIELDIDPKKMPLGKITKDQIESAKEIFPSLKAFSHDCADGALNR